MDCATEIVPGAKLPKPKLYSIMPRELDKLYNFIDKNLEHSFIQPARPKVTAPVQFWKKKDDSLHICVDHRGLNTVCVENM